MVEGSEVVLSLTYLELVGLAPFATLRVDTVGCRVDGADAHFTRVSHRDVGLIFCGGSMHGCPRLVSTVTPLTFVDQEFGIVF